MNLKKTIVILFVLLSTLNLVFSQSKKKYEIFLCEMPIPFSEKTLIDTIVLYEDSTFKYSGHYYSLGFHSEYSEGTYSKIDSCIILNSFQKYKRDFNVVERRRIGKGTKYIQKRGSYPFFYFPEICEFNNLNQKVVDTLFFPICEYNIESHNNNAIGFILYDEVEYVGEYVFKLKKNRKIIIEVGPKTYGFLYLKNEMFIVKGDTIIREKNNQIFNKQ